jgi:hypothetical protein
LSSVRSATSVFSFRFTDTYNGDFNEIKNNLNNCIDGLGGLVESNAALKLMAVNDHSRRVKGEYAVHVGEDFAAEHREAIRIAKKHLQSSPILRKITYAAFTAVEVRQ